VHVCVCMCVCDMGHVLTIYHLFSLTFNLVLALVLLSSNETNVVVRYTSRSLPLSPLGSSHVICMPRYKGHCVIAKVTSKTRAEMGIKRNFKYLL